MSIDIKQNTITVNGVTYDVERQTAAGYPVHEYLTLALDGEPVFEGLQGSIGYDETAHEFDNPREWSNVGTMAVSYGGYELGDEDISEIDFEVECGCDENTSCPRCDDTGYYTMNPVDYFKKERGARVVIPLTVYEHSGITMRAGDVTLPWDTDRWDTSFVGFIFDTPNALKECMGEGVCDEDIKKALEGEVKIYASYLEGDIMYYRVEDDETDYIEGCGAYVGDSDYCEEECFRSMETAIEKRLAERQERAEWAARDTVTT
jgi:hypothetical protein